MILANRGGEEILEVKLFQPLIAFNWNILFTAITVIVLILILKHFFFEKVHDFMVAREKAIQEALDNADQTNRTAEQKLSDYEAKISDVQGEGKEIIKAARQRATMQADQIVAEAKDKADGILVHTKKEIEREENNAKAQIKQEITTLAMMAAEQIMEKELSKEGHDEIIDKIIEEAGKSEWQN